MPRIIKRNNSYLIRVSCGKDFQGKQIIYNTTYVPKKTTPKAIEKEVFTFAQEYERKVKNGEILLGETETYNDLTEQWKKDWAVDHLTVGQCEQYVSTLERHILPKIGHIPISKITPLQIQNMVQDWKEKYAPKTVKRYVSTMNSVFKFAYRLSVIKDNPCSRIELPKQKKSSGIHCFTLEQSKAFLGFLSEPYMVKHKASQRKCTDGTTCEISEYYEKQTVPYQFQVYFHLAILGGFRRGELLALTWNDLDFVHNTISITKAVSDTKSSGKIIKKPKTQSGMRCLNMPSMCMDMLKAWRFQQYELSQSDLWEGKTGKEFNQNYIFIQRNGTLMDVKTPSHKFRDILKRYNATVENEEDKLPVIRLHDLRHTSATLLISEGTDIETVSHRLGHSKTSVTLDVYTHHLEAKDSEASNVLSKLFCAENEPQNVSKRISDSELTDIMYSLTPDQIEYLKYNFLHEDFVSRMCHATEKKEAALVKKPQYLSENSLFMLNGVEGVASSNLVIPTNMKKPCK